MASLFTQIMSASSSLPHISSTSPALLDGPTPNFSSRGLDQCRLRRIQNREDALGRTRPSADDTATPLAGSHLDSRALPHPPPSLHAANSPSSPPPNYPFPPPGLSKPSTPSQIPPRAKDMITPETESSSCTPRELELKLDALNPSTPPSHSQQSEADGSIWNSFQMESFLGNYCHTSGKSVPSPSLHGDNGNGIPCELSGIGATSLPGPISLSSSHWNRLKHLSSAVGTASTLNAATPSPQHSSFAPPLPLSLSTLSPYLHYPPSANVSPFMVHRQQQQAFMTRWNRVREKHRYAPVMPSFFNPMRAEVPQCTWTFLRDPACGGAVNERASARKGRDSIFEKALVKLPLTRCRSICDRVRRDQQNVFGWGIHAWISQSKHCRYCMGDEMLKGVLASRAFEFERYQQELQARRERRYPSLMSPLTLDIDMVSSSDDDAQDDTDPGAVFLSFPYRTSSNDTGDPWINYHEETTHSREEVSTTSKTPSNLDSDDIDAWSEELEKRLLASPVIRDLDDFDLEDLEDIEGEDGYYDDEDEDGYSSSGSSSDIYESDESDGDHSSGNGGEGGSGNGKEEGKPRSKVLVTFWEGDDLECISVEEAQEAEAREEEDWVKDMRVVEVQVQA